LGTYVQRDQGNISFNMANAPPNSFTSNAGGAVACNSVSCPGFATLSGIEAANPFGALGNIGIQAANKRDASQPQSYEWSLTWSQLVGPKTTLETSYVGNVSRHLFNIHNVNVVQPGAMFIPGTTNCCKDGDNVAVDYAPYKPWGNIGWADHSQTANYHSLQVTARRNVSQGLTFLTTYTWSKTLGFSSNFQGGTDPFDTRRNYGLLPWDRRHLLNFSYIYQLPNLGTRYIGRNRLSKGVLDGWQLSGITHYASGSPLRITTGSVSCTPSALCQTIGKFSGNGITWFGTPDVALTPAILLNPQYGVKFNGVGGLWLDQNFVTLPAINSFGTFEQPTFRGPGSGNWDMTLFKRFPLGERRRIEFRVAAFDVFNYSHFDNPQTSASFDWVLPPRATAFRQGRAELANRDSFGRITNKHGHREMEVALKIYF